MMIARFVLIEGEERIGECIHSIVKVTYLKIPPIVVFLNLFAQNNDGDTM